MSLADDLAMDLGGDDPGYSFLVATPELLAAVTPLTGPPGALDFYLDPTTFDYVRTSDGDWLLTNDSRTAVLLMHELVFGASVYTPGDGTVIHDLFASGEPVTPELLRSEAVRIGQILQRDGILTGMTVTVRDREGNDLVDDKGRQIVFEQWIDLASGSPIDAVYTPR